MQKTARKRKMPEENENEERERSAAKRARDGGRQQRARAGVGGGGGSGSGGENSSERVNESRPRRRRSFSNMPGLSVSASLEEEVSNRRALASAHVSGVARAGCVQFSVLFLCASAVAFRPSARTKN